MSKMVKIYDCSNSSERPAHRGTGGPVTNDIIRYLKQYAHLFSCSFVDHISNADVILTNDVFPKDVVNLSMNLSIPKVKRMDGVFFQEDLKDRNLSLNESARIADRVIFISEFSKKSYFELYGDTLKSYKVIKNQADPKVFHPGTKVRPLKRFIAYATDWNREEKRLNAIIKFSELFPEFSVYIIGKCPRITWPYPHIVEQGYMGNHEKIAKTLKQADAMLCFAYKDACPKTVVQGVACGLPVLYTGSGGVPEIVFSGVMVPDSNSFCFEEKIPELNESYIKEAGEKFKQDFECLRDKAMLAPNNFYEMLEGYFDTLRFL